MAFPSLSTLVSPSALSSEELPGGNRKVSTWPFDSPTVSNGSLGCKAVVKTSAWRGSVQVFSNMVNQARAGRRLRGGIEG